MADRVLRDGTVVLRPWREHDAVAVHAACQDPDILRWIPEIPRPYTLEHARAFVSGAVGLGPHQYAVTLGGEVVGAIGLVMNDSRTGTVGYWCAPSARSKGVTTRALRLLVRHAFDDLGSERLELTVDPANPASQRVAEKAGFAREGVLRSRTLHPDGRRRDAILYARLPADAGAFYDAVLDTYRSAVAAGPGSANHVMEEPAVLEALSDPRGLRVLELGCGDGAFGRRLLDAGSASYLGIDASERMTAAARTALRTTGGEVRHEAIEDFTAPPGAFDLVVSRMALHYVEDIDRTLAACHRALAADGRILVTVVHPVITSCDPRASTDEPRTSWVVDDYFTPGPREQNWLGDRVVWHHRTMEEYVAAFRRAGFTLTRISECPPRPERFEDDAAELARRRRIPLFLLLAGTITG